MAGFVMKSTTERIHLLDFIRGCAILAMVAHHAAYDLVAFYEISIPFLETALFEAIRTMFALSFIVISGISTGLSGNPVRRGLVTLAGALTVSVATFIITPEMPIRFGILHFMGVSMLIMGLLKKSIHRVPRKIALPMLSILFIICYFVFPIVVDADYMYPLGLISTDFVSSDYYPLIPWVFAFIIGSYLTEPLLMRKAPHWVYTFQVKLINLCGKHTLWIFMLHQPFLLAIFWLWFNIVLP